MIDLSFNRDPKIEGNLVEIIRGPPPLIYLVRTWINGQLAEMKGFAVEADARRYQSSQLQRYI